MSEDDNLRCDVLVCGGGPGGLAAAVSAARNGADTLLVERYGFLGGMATAGLVFPFMTRYAGDERIIEGILQEIIERLDAKGGYGGPDKPYMFDTEIFKLVADEICLDSGVRLLLHSMVTGADVDGSIIRAAKITNKSGEQAVRARIYIDATGDADLAHMAGVPLEKGRRSDGLAQPMTLNFRMAGVDLDRMPPGGEITSIYLKAREQGRVDCPRNDILYFFTTRNDEIHFNTTRIICADATNTDDLTRAEIESRRQVKQLVAFFRSDIPGFENAYLQMTAPQIGIRESRRIVGEYVMTADDVMDARKFDDCISRGSYPVDIHDPKGGGTDYRCLAPGESYDIPYRCLVPLKIDNLLVAGRPISTTHEAHSAIRIMPICFALGQAAGAAAAVCIKDGMIPRRIDTKILQRMLVGQGANLGAHVQEALQGSTEVPVT